MRENTLYTATKVNNTLFGKRSGSVGTSASERDLYDSYSSTSNRKKNSLYTANEYNKNLFALGDSLKQYYPSNLVNSTGNSSIDSVLTGMYGDGKTSTPKVSMPLPAVNTPSVTPIKSNDVQDIFEHSGSKQNPAVAEASQSAGSFLGGIGKTLGGVMGGGKLLGTPMGGLIGGLGSAVGGLANNLISSGYSSGAGSAISSIGGTVGSALSTVNPLLGGIVSVGSGIIGGATNALFGEKVDQAKLNAVNSSISNLGNFTSNAASFDDIKGPQAAFTNTDVYKGGVFNSSADDKNEELKQQLMAAQSWAQRSVENNVSNLSSDQMSNALRNYSAFGGPLSTSLTRKKIRNKRKYSR